MRPTSWLRLGLLASLFAFLLAPLAAFSGAALAQPAARHAASIANGTVIRDYADGRLYLVWDGVRYPIPSLAVLDALGYSHGAIVNLQHANVAALAAGSPLSLRSPTNPHAPVAIGSAMLTVSPPSAAPGKPVALGGIGFGPNELVQITVASTSTAAPTDAHGAFHTTITVPAGAKVGSILQVYAYGTRSKILEVEPLKVTSARITVPANGTVIRDYADGRLYLAWAGARYPIPSLTVLNTLGYSHSAIVNLQHANVAALAAGPPLSLRSPANPHAPVALGSAMIQLFPPSAARGAHVGLAGSGFAPGEAVRITVGKSTSSATADASGAFRATIIVPAGAKVGSTLQVYAYGTSSRTLEVEPLKVS